MEATMSSRYFPSELLFDILIKLPVKTLIRFQCVSKSIQAIIIDPTFISTHRDRCASKNNGGSRYIIKFICRQKKSFYLSSHVDDQKLGVHGNVLKLPDELLGSDIDMNINGSCHSLLCFSGKQYQGFPCNTYLWNPSIRVVKKLPDFNPLPPEYDDRSLITYLCGIGFDNRTNDYKVLQIIHGYRNACCRIYSLSTNSWRWIESYPTFYLRQRSYISFSLLQSYYKQSCTCWKDSLYWIAHEYILSFNLSDEIFEIISLPSDMIFKFNNQYSVIAANFGLIKESLALFVECSLHEDMSVWVLKKELSEGGGIGSSWSKLFSIDQEWIYRFPYNVGLCGHDILIQRYMSYKDWNYRYCLGAWDFREEEFKSLGVSIYGFASDVYPYSESLVLLNQLQS